MANAPLIHPQAQEFTFQQGFPCPVDGTSGVLHHKPSTDTAAVCTVDADSARENFIHAIQASYGATPTGGSVQVESPSGTVVWGPHAIERAGLVSIKFDPPLSTTKNQATIVTLAAGGSSIQGVLDIQATRLY